LEDGGFIDINLAKKEFLRAIYRVLDGQVNKDEAMRFRGLLPPGIDFHT
jgi:hypothetical protein